MISICSFFPPQAQLILLAVSLHCCFLGGVGSWGFLLKCFFMNFLCYLLSLLSSVVDLIGAWKCVVMWAWRCCTCLLLSDVNYAPDLDGGCSLPVSLYQIYKYQGRSVHNQWFQFQLSLLQSDYELSRFMLFVEMPNFPPCHDPLVRLPPAPLISAVSI